MKVKVGNTKYELIKTSGDEILDQYYPDEDIFDIAGLIDKFNTSIYINKEFSSQTVKQTFWHEIVHGMLYEIGRHELNSDEGLVDAIGGQLYGLFENNNIDKIYQFLDK